MSPRPDPYGRDAMYPSHIPLKGWWQVAQRVWTESGRDNLTVIAAGCAFYALFAIFPALSALIALYGLTADPAAVTAQFSMLSLVLPPDAFDMVVSDHPHCRCLGPRARLEPCRQSRPGAMECHAAGPGHVLGPQCRL